MTNLFKDFIRHDDGTTSWTQMQDDKYVITGVDIYRRRFSITTNNWYHAKGINIFRGSIWLVRNGKRKLILRVL